MSTSTLTDNLSDRINALAESATIGMAKKARELGAQGISVINLSFGEPDFQTPQYIKDAAKKAIDDGFTFYTPVPGIPDLKKSIVDKLKKDNNLDYKPENIVVSTGAKQSIANALLCLVNPGDEVIVYAPYWVSYSELVTLAGGVSVLIDGGIENDFKATIEQLKAAITPKTKVIMFSSPCNPTGSVFTAQELSDIADVVAANENIFVIADEIYEYINFGEKHVSIASFPQVKERVVTINGYSKGFAMTGWRVGYMAAEKYIADACDKLQGQVTSGTCSIAQKAAVVAYSDLTETYKMTEAFLRRRNLCYDLLKDIPGVKVNLPKGAFYFFIDISSFFGKKDLEGNVINSAEQLSMVILNDAHVSTVTGEAFGADKYIRMSFAASDENLIKALGNIKATLAKLV
ncbi:MAG: hypothetical protein RL308_3587 [Bacteroidota bacterium]|jgi:aspartate aminotransferase